MPLGSGAATNDLSGLLQKGLFEEEANRNLEAAAQAYSTVSAQFDKDRKLAATAIFRLGEIYRKQGKTNEAAGQYERIVREFADQDTLVMLSRQNLVALRATPVLDDLPALNGLREVQTRDAEILKKIKNLSPTELRQVLPTLMPDELLTKLLNQYQASETERADRYHLSPEFPSKYQQVQSLDDRLKKLDEQIQQRAEGIIKALEIRISATSGPAQGGGAPTESVPTDDEEKEIRRIQAMIQNSPDLINGPGEGQTPLFAAAGAGRLRVATFLLDNGANVNKASGGQTPLHSAVQSGHKAMVELLLQRGADVNAKDGTGGTALHEAAQNGFLSIAEVLLKYKADLNARNSKSNGEVAPLHRAAKNGHAALVGFLLANGDDANRRDAAGQTPLHFAVSLGRESVVERLLNSGADVNATDTAGETPLIEAAQAGHSVSVKALLAAKAKPDLLDEKGRTALSYAAEKGHAECVNALLAAKVDPNASRYNLPLHIAIHGNSPTMVEALLRADADANRVAAITYQERNGNTTAFDCNPLYLAVAENNPEAVKLLLQFKADPNGISPTKEPMLFRAVGNIPILKALLEAGADANAKDLEGASVLIKAANYTDAVKLLLDHRAQVDTRDKSQMTALLWAAETRNLKSAELLLAAKADANARNSCGFTPLHSTVAASQKQLVELLLANGADPNIRDSGGMTPLDYAKPKPGTAIPTASISGQPRGETPAKPEELAALLRQHGALDDLPKFDRIEVRRPAGGNSEVVFRKEPEDWNRFSLFEALATVYGMTASVGSQTLAPPVRTGGRPGWSFPDLVHVKIHRPNAEGITWKEIPVDVAVISKTGDCGGDIPLEWGDVLEIPETDHLVTDPPQGISQAEREFLARCLKRVVNVRVHGESKAVELAPNLSGTGRPSQFSVRWALESSGLLRASSDTTNVKIIRSDAKTGKTLEWVRDCSNPSNFFPATGDPNPKLWLRDGDVIEVPDKP